MLRQRLNALIFLLSFALTGTLAVSSAGAVNLFPQCADKTNVSTVCQQQRANQPDLKKAPTNPIVKALSVAINILSILVGVSAVIGLILAGFNMVTSSGDTQKFAKARMAIIYSLIALAIVALAQTMVAFVLKSL